MDDRKFQHAQMVYRENQIKMASREQLLLITYDIGIRHCLIAEEEMKKERTDVEKINFSLQKAQAVLRELMVTIDMEKGGEVGENLMRLYDFMFYRLVQANTKKDSELVKSVREMLEDLKSAWEEAISTLKSDEIKESAKAVPKQSGGADFAY